MTGEVLTIHISGFSGWTLIIAAVIICYGLCEHGKGF